MKSGKPDQNYYASTKNAQAQIGQKLRMAAQPSSAQKHQLYSPLVVHRDSQIDNAKLMGTGGLTPNGP